MLSAILYGSRVSLMIGLAAIVLSVTTGVLLGLLAGFRGGWVEAVIMRLADIQLTVPAILIALTLDGVARAALPKDVHDDDRHLGAGALDRRSPTGRNSHASPAPPRSPKRTRTTSTPRASSACPARASRWAMCCPTPGDRCW